jgi:hypothetical protein
MAELGINVEVLISGREVRIVVPQQRGLDFETVAPRLTAFANELGAEMNLPVTIEGVPERHLHTPITGDGQRVSFGTRHQH